MEIKLVEFTQWAIDLIPLLTLQLGLVLLVRQGVGKFFGAKVRYQLWLLPIAWCLLLLLVNLETFQLSSQIPGFDQSIPSISVFITETFSADIYPEVALPNSQNSILQASDLWLAISSIWLFGTVVTFSYQLVLYMHFHLHVIRHRSKLTLVHHERLRKLMPTAKSIPTYSMRNLSSPLVYGFWRGCILLPEDMGDKFDIHQQRSMLSHEVIHYSRKDNIVNALALILRSLFWFNPVFYLAHHYYRLDQEVSCDAHVLENSTALERQTYAQALLTCVSSANQSSSKLAISNWVNYQSIKERTTMIGLHHRVLILGKWKLLLVLSLLIFGTIGSTALTRNFEINDDLGFARSSLMPETSKINISAAAANHSSASSQASGVSSAQGKVAATDRDRIIDIEIEILELSLDRGFDHALDKDLFSGQTITNFTDFDSILDLIEPRASTQRRQAFDLKIENFQKAVFQDADRQFFQTDFSNGRSDVVLSADNSIQPYLSGISMEITPQVNSAEELLLHVKPRISLVSSTSEQVDGKTVNLVSSRTREFDSIIKAEAGNVIVLGGLRFDRDVEGSTIGSEFIILLKAQY